MTKLQDATRQVNVATKELQREQQEWHTTLANLKREKLQLTVSNRALEKKKIKLEASIVTNTLKLDDIADQIDKEEQHKKSLEVEVDELESKRADKATELADLHAEVKNRKATIDSEVEAYALERKTAIKEDILAVNGELTGARAELQQVHDDIQVKHQELASLNQAAIQEQQDLKAAKASVDQELITKREDLIEVKEDIESAKKDLQKLFYDRDNAMITIAKAKEEHDKFLNYEEKARKILDAKDRELQTRSADIAQESQFIKNRRTFLPEM